MEADDGAKRSDNAGRGGEFDLREAVLVSVAVDPMPDRLFAPVSGRQAGLGGAWHEKASVKNGMPAPSTLRNHPLFRKA